MTLGLMQAAGPPPDSPLPMNFATYCTTVRTDNVSQSQVALGPNATKLSADLGKRWMPSSGLPFDGVCFTVRVGCFSILGGLAEWCVVVDLVVGVGVVRVRVWRVLWSRDLTVCG